MTTQIYKFDDFSLSPKQRKLLYLNSPVTISTKAFEILLIMVERQGEIVEKDEFLQKIWTDSFVEESNLVVHISALRRILLEKKGERKFIETVSGRGYSFISPVTIVEAEDAAQTQVFPASKKPVSETADSAISIAVLPLQFKNYDADLEYLANGITQSLIDSLSQIPQLKVMAYSAVATYKNAELDPQEIGFLLGAENLLAGYISEYKNNLEIRVELIETKDKRHLWGISHEARFDDIFQIKKEISLAIAQKLKLKLTASDKTKIGKSQTTDSEAYKLYLKGKYIIERLSTRKDREESLYQTLGFFQQALKKDVNFALAYTGIGDVYNLLFNHGFLKRDIALAEARKALQLALRIDPALSEIYVTKGTIEILFDRNFLAARDSFGEATRLNPNNSIAYNWLSMTYQLYEEFDEAIAMQNKAINLDPISVMVNFGMSKLFYLSGDYNKTIIQAEETLDFDQRYVGCFYLLALSYAELGIYDEAIKNARRAVEIQPMKETILTLAYVYAIAGETEKAVELLNQTLDRPDVDLIDHTDVAAVYLALGEREKSLESLEKAYETGSVNIGVLRVDPRFKSLRNEERFVSLLKKLNLK